MSHPSVVIEPPGNNWRWDNNNDNYRQIQTHLSGRRSMRDQSRDKHRSKKGRRWRSASTPLHPPFQLLHLQTLERESQKDLNIPVRKEEGYTSPSFSSSVSHSQIHDYGAGLGGSVGCAVWLEPRRSRVQPPPRSATFFRGDWPWNIFYSHSLPSTDSRRAVVSFWRKNVHNTG